MYKSYLAISEKGNPGNASMHCTDGYSHPPDCKYTIVHFVAVVKRPGPAARLCPSLIDDLLFVTFD